VRCVTNDQMFALDQSIVATAIPVLVSDFNAFEQVPWVITGYVHFFHLKVNADLLDISVCSSIHI
jgi:hypothetical protein